MYIPNFNKEFLFFHPKKATKKRQKKRQKSDKKRQNANKKIGSSKKATKLWCSFWSVAAHPRTSLGRKKGYQIYHVGVLAFCLILIWQASVLLRVGSHAMMILSQLLSKNITQASVLESSSVLTVPEQNGNSNQKWR
jgi:hypothetical protein